MPRRMIVSLLGGVGLFLVGMVLLTDGLKGAAGDGLRAVLQRFTGGPWRGFASGAVLTTATQSSSATTVMTIGFVSAGLLTFPQALGVIIGANVGTTSTGWFVALLGLKVSIGAYALPAIGIGALLKLIGKDRVASLGLAICGFGLLFHGIDVLQDAMRVAADDLNPAMLGGSDAGGRLLLFLLGIGMTIVLQSSSAAVATVLTALHTGSIELSQSLFVVVGANVGTTVTAAFAAIGASIHAKRTAVAHIAFNVVTAAVILVPLLAAPQLLNALVASLSGLDPAIALATFHTATKLLGTAIFMPWIHGYARLLTRIVRPLAPTYTSHLDPSVARTGHVAIEAARRAIVGIHHDLVQTCDHLLGGVARLDEVRARTRRMHEAIHETRAFLALVSSHPDAKGQYQRHVSVVHAADHIDRLAEAAVETQPARVALNERSLAALVAEVRDLFRLVQPWLADPRPAPEPDVVAAVATRIADARRTMRPKLLDQVASGDIDPERASDVLEATRWLDRIAYHSWRAYHHLHV